MKCGRFYSGDSTSWMYDVFYNKDRASKSTVFKKWETLEKYRERGQKNIIRV